MAKRHTPGPWIWRGKSGSLHRVGEGPYAYGDCVLAPTYEYDAGVDIIVSEADARLIAAAPDMFAALHQARGALLLDHMVDAAGQPFGTTTVALEAIDAAIAKITAP